MLPSCREASTCFIEIEYLVQVLQTKGTNVFQLEECGAVVAESSGVSAGFQSCTNFIGSEMIGYGVKLVLHPDESHYSSCCGIWTVES